MTAFILMLAAAAMIGALRIDYGIDEHDHNVLDAEYKKQLKGD